MMSQPEEPAISHEAKHYLSLSDIYREQNVAVFLGNSSTSTLVSNFKNSFTFLHSWLGAFAFELVT
jgi:hypothetical protein